MKCHFCQNVAKGNVPMLKMSICDSCATKLHREVWEIIFPARRCKCGELTPEHWDECTKCFAKKGKPWWIQPEAPSHFMERDLERLSLERHKAYENMKRLGTMNANLDTMGDYRKAQDAFKEADRRFNEAIKRLEP
jgi:hypothetical protein